MKSFINVTFVVIIFMLLYCQNKSINNTNYNNPLYETSINDTVIVKIIKAYCKDESLNPKQQCITLTSMPVAGGRCSFISNLKIHPSINSNYPNYWCYINGYLVFIYDPIFKEMKNEKYLIEEINNQIKLNKVTLIMHPAIHEPVSLRVLQIDDSTLIKKTDYYPSLKNKFGN